MSVPVKLDCMVTESNISRNRIILHYIVVCYEKQKVPYYFITKSQNSIYSFKLTPSIQSVPFHLKLHDPLSVTLCIARSLTTIDLTPFQLCYEKKVPWNIYFPCISPFFKSGISFPVTLAEPSHFWGVDLALSLHRLAHNIHEFRTATLHVKDWSWRSINTGFTHRS